MELETFVSGAIFVTGALFLAFAVFAWLVDKHDRKGRGR